jgi:hypothetical protein
MYVVSQSSDHFRDRGIHIAVLALVTMIAYALLATQPGTHFQG